MLKKTLLFFFIFSSFTFLGQTSKISGKIVDELTGLGIPFATVQIKGSEKGTTSSLDGEFYIEAEKDQVLLIRMVGYISQELLVGDDMINFKILLKNETLKEMVVVGYGSRTISNYHHFF